MIPIRQAFLQAARSAASLLAEPQVAARWSEPSALPEFAVSGLAGHLASQIFSVPSALAGEAPLGEPLPLLNYYGQAQWVGAGPDAQVNVGIRERGEHFAAGGAAKLAARAASTVAKLPDALAREPADRVVLARGARESLQLDDYLVTRMMEIAVHSDDLAVSVDIEAPPLPPSVLDPVVMLLTQLAVRRHGQAAVLRALSRAERAPATISAF